MIENVTSPDTYLYHYTRSSTAVDFIFKNRTLLLGRYKDTNDPKESKDWEFSLGTNQERDLGEYKMAEVSNWLSSELKQKIRLACFSMDHAPLTGDHIKDIHRRGFCKPRMWAQYGERHTGVCIVSIGKSCGIKSRRSLLLPTLYYLNPCNTKAGRLFAPSTTTNI